jgi:hypothetical protein
MADGELAAAASGVFPLGGTVAVTRLGYGAMRITGRGIWGEPADPGRDQPRPAPGAGQPICLPADIRSWQASTTRAVIDSSAALPQDRGS